MLDRQLIYPMFAMVLLTFSILVRLFRARVAAIANGSIKMSFFRIYQDGAEPESSAAFSRSFISQFEAPVLFYAACVTAMALHVQSVLLVSLAWAYFASRVIHMYIHTGKNRVRHRFQAYFAGWIILLSMWVMVVCQISISPA